MGQWIFAAVVQVMYYMMYNYLENPVQSATTANIRVCVYFKGNRLHRNNTLQASKQLQVLYRCLLSPHCSQQVKWKRTLYTYSVILSIWCGFGTVATSLRHLLFMLSVVYVMNFCSVENMHDSEYFLLAQKKVRHGIKNNMKMD